MQLKATIYKPAKTAMSSGQAKTRKWVLEYKPIRKNTIEPLMGWTAGGTLQQVRLEFDSKAEAIAYAEDKNLSYEVKDPHARIYKPKSYAANFAYNKRVAF